MSETRIPLPHIQVQLTDNIPDADGKPQRLMSIQWYRYFESSVDAVLIDLASKLDKALADGYIWIGDATGVATAVLMSGDITITDTGVTLIGPKKVSYSKIQDVSATQKVLARNTAGSGSVEEVGISAILDWLGSTRGSVIYRGASGWAILAPGTSGYALTSNGAGADPSYQAGSGGTVTTVSVVTANGASGSVANPTTAPAITLSFATQSPSDNSTKIATTAYVTTAIANAVAAVNPAVAVQAATTSAANTSGLTYNNGASGIGAFFTGSINTPITVDGYTFTAVGQRLLVKNDTQSPSGAFNGVYYVTQIQTAILPPILTRALDYDMPSDINNTGAVPVVNGTVNALTSWLLTTIVTTVGTDPLTYTQFSFAPTAYTGGAGITVTGNSIAITSYPALSGASITSLNGANIAAGTVAYAAIQNVTTNRLLGRSTAGSGVTEEITPTSGARLSGGNLTVTRVAQIQVSDPNGSAIAVADGAAYFRVNSELNSMKLFAVAAAVTTVSSSGLPNIQIRSVTNSYDMLTTALTIDANETDSSTAATPAVIDTASSHDVVHTADMLAIDIDGAGTGTKGLMVELSFRLP